MVTPEAPASTGVENRGSGRKKKDLTLDESNVYITLVLAGKEIPCLLDSDCEATTVPRSMLTHRQIVKMTPTSRKVYAANDTPIQVEGNYSCHSSWVSSVYGPMPWFGRY